MTAYPDRTMLSVKPEVTAFFDAPTNTISYVVKDPGSHACAVIDSVMDIDYAAGRITYDIGRRDHRLHPARTASRSNG